MCVCALHVVYLYVLKIFMMCQMKISQWVSAYCSAAHIHPYTHMCLYRWVCLKFRCKQNIHEQMYVCVCVFIITDTILSIKINSTKGNRADTSSSFLHLIQVTTQAIT